MSSERAFTGSALRRPSGGRLGIGVAAFATLVLAIMLVAGWRGLDWSEVAIENETAVPMVARVYLGNEVKQWRVGSIDSVTVVRGFHDPVTKIEMVDPVTCAVLASGDALRGSFTVLFASEFDNGVPVLRVIVFSVEPTEGQPGPDPPFDGCS